MQKQNKVLESLKMNLNIDLAFSSILKEDRKGENPIPDPLRFSYILANKDELFKEINKKISEGDYGVRPLLTIDVPKPNFTIRPMARPEIEDWITYQAMIDYLSPKISKKISKRSYSILRFKSSESSIDGWKQWDEKSRALYESGNKYVVVADISGYFENIDLKKLKEKLINYFENTDRESQEIINFLYNKLLTKWSTGRVENFGLPQGPRASIFLGDVYLDTVDREMESFKGYLRYMDDVRIFCKSEFEAKKALLQIIRSLRNYKLNINAKKTKILLPSDGVRSLFDKEKPTLDSIQSAIDSKNEYRIKALIPVMENLFMGGFDSNNYFDQRHLRFCLFRYNIFKSSGISFNEKLIVDKIINNFVDNPQDAKLFCDFLVLFPNDNKIHEFLIKFIFSRDNIYEWQELHVLKCLLQFNLRPNKNIVNKFYRKFKNKNLHWSVRSLYCLLVGRYGTQQDRELLSDQFNSAENIEIKKAILLSTQKLGVASRNNFYSRVANQIWPNTYSNYLKGMNSEIYIIPTEKIILENLNIQDFEEEY